MASQCWTLFYVLTIFGIAFSLLSVFFMAPISRSYAASPASNFEQDLDSIIQEMLRDVETQIDELSKKIQVMEREIDLMKNSRVPLAVKKGKLEEITQKISALSHAKWRLRGVQSRIEFLMYHASHFFDIIDEGGGSLSAIRSANMWLEESMSTIKKEQKIISDFDKKLDHVLTQGCGTVTEKFTGEERRFMREAHINGDALSGIKKTSPAEIQREAKVLRGYIHERMEILRGAFNEREIFRAHPERYRNRLAHVNRIVDSMRSIFSNNTLAIRMSTVLDEFRALEKMRDIMIVQWDSILDGTYKKYFKIFENKNVNQIADVTDDAAGFLARCRSFGRGAVNVTLKGVKGLVLLLSAINVVDAARLTPQERLYIVMNGYRGQCSGISQRKADDIFSTLEDVGKVAVQATFEIMPGVTVSPNSQSGAIIASNIDIGLNQEISKEDVNMFLDILKKECPGLYNDLVSGASVNPIAHQFRSDASTVGINNLPDITALIDYNIDQKLADAKDLLKEAKEALRVTEQRIDRIENGENPPESSGIRRVDESMKKQSSLIAALYEELRYANIPLSDEMKEIKKRLSKLENEYNQFNSILISIGKEKKTFLEWRDELEKLQKQKKWHENRIDNLIAQIKSLH